MLDGKSLPKNKRSDHIQNCVRQEMVKKLVRVPSEIRYCHLCFKWIVGDEWEPHCALHLSSLTTKRCGTLSHCNTLVRPGYSPFRLGKKEESAAYRLQSWSRDFDLWIHVNDEVDGRRWPILCPHPLCDILLKGDRDLQFHFIDDHGFSRTRPGQPASANIFEHDGDDRSVKTTGELTSLNHKRKPSSSSDLLERDDTQRSSPTRPPKKKFRFNSPTISLPLLSAVDPTAVQPEDESGSPLLPLAQGLTLSDLSDSELECGRDDVLLQRDQQPDQPDDDWAVGGGMTWRPSEHGPFFPSIRSRSSSIASTDVPSANSSEAAAAKAGSDPSNSSDHVDDNSGFDMLFDQFLRSPSPVFSPDSTGSKISQGTLVDIERNQPVVITEPSKSPPTEAAKEGEAVVGQKGLCRATNVPRLRLRVREPQITLKLNLSNKFLLRSNKDREGGKEKTRKRRT